MYKKFNQLLFLYNFWWLVRNTFIIITFLKIYPFLCRYFVLIDPIEHARRRTTKFVLGTITIVWMLSILICSPPLMGWNNWPSPENWTIGKNFGKVPFVIDKCHIIRNSYRISALSSFDMIFSIPFRYHLRTNK